jgi:excinuclease UvrABC ATPase subunit
MWTHRRPLAGDLDRAEDHQPQPALDRRHGHRDLRLHAPAVGARRRALFAGHRPADREPDRVSRWSTSVDGAGEGTRFYLLAPIVRGRKGEYKKEFAELLKRGFQRVKVDGEFYELEDPPKLDKKLKHDIDVVVDRIVMKAGMERASPRVSRPR